MDNGLAVILGAVVVVGAGAAGVSAALSRYTSSNKAKQLGVSNQPDNAAELANAEYSATLVDPLLGIAREVDPGAYFSSGYRSDVVNVAVGGVSTSTHADGRGIDIATAKPFEVANHIRANAHRLPGGSGILQEVIAETTPLHCHVGVWGPGKTGSTEWLGEYDATKPNKFTALRAIA